MQGKINKYYFSTRISHGWDCWSSRAYLSYHSTSLGHTWSGEGFILTLHLAVHPAEGCARVDRKHSLPYLTKIILLIFCPVLIFDRARTGWPHCIAVGLFMFFFSFWAVKSPSYFPDLLLYSGSTASSRASSSWRGPFDRPICTRMWTSGRGLLM